MQREINLQKNKYQECFLNFGTEFKAMLVVAISDFRTPREPQSVGGESLRESNIFVPKCQNCLCKSETQHQES